MQIDSFRKLVSHRALSYVAFVVVICVASILASCVSTSTPSNANNICQIFDEKRSWYRSAARSERKWGIPVPVLMAVINKESAFQAGVRPARKKILGILPWKRPTTSLGYSQAKDETWWDYIKATKNRTANRKNFADSVDFVGWYLRRSVDHAGIAPNNAAHLYMTYHSGLSGYQSGSWQKSDWLKDAAARVQSQANRYASQLKRCNIRRRR